MFKSKQVSLQHVDNHQVICENLVTLTFFLVFKKHTKLPVRPLSEIPKKTMNDAFNSVLNRAKCTNYQHLPLAARDTQSQVQLPPQFFPFLFKKIIAVLRLPVVC